MSEKVDLFDIDAGVPEIQGDMRPPPTVPDRISRRVLWVVFAVVAIIVGVFLFALGGMDKVKEVKVPKSVKVAVTAPANSDDVLGVDVPAGSATNGKGTNLPRSETPANTVISAVVVDKAAAKTLFVGSVPALGSPGMGSIPAEKQAVMNAVVVLTPAQQLENQEKLARGTRMTQARNTGLSAKPFGVDEKVASAGAGAGAGISNDVNALAALARQVGSGTTPVNYPAPAKAEGEQESKLDFLKNLSKEDNRYHPYAVMPAMSVNEIKIGSFIPMVLEQGINSDLPGQITARVTEDVYDSITGCRMLVPAMSKVVGRYDSKVALGQGRMLIGWNALVFPDGAELNLGGMQGYDTSGQSGLPSEVDNHYLRLFGATFGLSMITAGVTLSVPQPNPGVGGSASQPTVAQTVAAALAQQYGNLGSQILGKYMAVQPTLRNVAGERFVVMVPKTIVFKKVWRDRCVATTR